MAEFHGGSGMLVGRSMTDDSRVLARADKIRAVNAGIGDFLAGNRLIADIWLNKFGCTGIHEGENLGKSVGLIGLTSF